VLPHVKVGGVAPGLRLHAQRAGRLARDVPPRFCVIYSLFALGRLAVLRLPFYCTLQRTRYSVHATAYSLTAARMCIRNSKEHNRTCFVSKDMLYRARRVPSSASPHERTSTALKGGVIKGFEEAYQENPTRHSRNGMTEHKAPVRRSK
jgi:hypothetical protein